MKLLAHALCLCLALALALAASLADSEAELKADAAATVADADKAVVAATVADADKAVVAAADADADKAVVAAADADADKAVVAAADADADKAVVAAADADADKAVVAAADAAAAAAAADIAGAVAVDAATDAAAATAAAAAAAAAADKAVIVAADKAVAAATDAAAAAAAADKAVVVGADAAAAATAAAVAAVTKAVAAAADAAAAAAAADKAVAAAADKAVVAAADKAVVANDHDHEAPEMDRCQGMEMDAATVDEDGTPLFFKGEHLFLGFHGKARLSNDSFPELDEAHNLAHADAAFRMQHTDSPDHNHMYLFLDQKVFSFYKHRLEDGFPKDISEVFPGVPSNLDAAVECPQPDCAKDSVIFFKGASVFLYEVNEKTVQEKTFESLPKCSSALRHMENYYCFQGQTFYKFNPQSGEVDARYPKEARNYFMRCSKFSEDTDHVDRERCSLAHLDAATADHEGNVYVFRGHYFSRITKDNKTLTTDTIDSVFKEVHADVDAVYSHNNQLHMIKGNEVFIYQDEAPFALIDNHSKSLMEVLGMEGPVDAAFVCDDDHDDIVHVIKGDHVYDVDLKASVRAAVNERTMAHSQRIDAAMCDKSGIKSIWGTLIGIAISILGAVTSKSLPVQGTVAMELFGCDH